MGQNFADNHPQITKAMQGGLSGLGQGLQQYGNPNPVFNFKAPQQPQRPKKTPLNQTLQQSQQMNPFSANPDWGGYT